jgi:malonyl-CoA O-methyltransferase
MKKINPALFESHAAVLRELANRLIERLDYVKLTPEVIINLSDVANYSQSLLREKFSTAHILNILPCHSMLKYYAETSADLTLPYFIQAQNIHLPLKAASVDFIFANHLMLHPTNIAEIFSECRRLLKPNGLLLFNALGPDCLQELKQAFAKQDKYQHINSFMDMHDMGDVMLACGLSDPALDTERLTISYPSVPTILHELKALGPYPIQGAKKLGLTTVRQLAALTERLAKDETGRFPITLEVIYGLAWGSELAPRNQRQGNDVLIPVDSIKRA